MGNFHIWGIFIYGVIPVTPKKLVFVVQEMSEKELGTLWSTRSNVFNGGELFVSRTKVGNVHRTPLM